MILKSVLILLLSCWLVTADGNNEFTSSEEIWAFGDTHGGNAEFEKLLIQVKLIDSQLNWTGGKAHLVSTGDVLDRGPHPRKILDLMMKLEQQAEAAGGKFHLLLGNHEVMILIGDLRYVSPAEYAEFAADETAVMREGYFHQYLSYLYPQKEIDSSALSKGKLQDLRQQFNDEHPDGFFARYEAFLPTGKYGRWLLKKNIVLRINNNIFLHGGLSPVLMGINLAELNQQLKSELKTYLHEWRRLINNNQLPVASIFRQRSKSAKGLGREELEQFSSLSDNLLFNSQSPTWYRGAVFCHPYYEQESLDDLLFQFNAKRLFIGHTVTGSRLVEQRLLGRVFALDTGMLAMVYNGQGNIVKIHGDQVDSYSSDGSRYSAKIARHQAIEYPGQIPKLELQEILREGEIVDIEALDLVWTQKSRYTFDYPGATIRAVVESGNNDGVSGTLQGKPKNEIAAYELSEILGFHLVPMAVEREIDGAAVVLQYWLEDSYSEYLAKQEGRSYRGHCDYQSQINLMNIFDLLINNLDRKSENILVESNQKQLIWTGHLLAFSEYDHLPDGIDKYNIHLTPQVYQALQNLNQKLLEDKLGALLNSKQISAILKRRDLILGLNTL